MKKVLLFSTLVVLAFAACKATYNPHTAFDPKLTPAAPDYSRPENWAALPTRFDVADLTPSPSLKDMQDTALVDVFFLHPTTLTESRKEWEVWNGDLTDEKLNKKTDNSPIKYQASAFNGAGRIYAPRYRQAHLYSFFTKDKATAAQALDTAYTDVVAAFRYYIKHWNQGRPFIIASHSQGSRHAMLLLKQEIENTPLKKQLVAAYLAGWPVPQNYFATIPPCESPDQTGCFCSWRTYERKYGLKNAAQPDITCTNPILWKTGTNCYAPKSLNKGAVVYDFEKVLPQICDAEPYKGILLCSKPKFRGSFLIRTKNYHPGDINLYYMNVRENAALRADVFLKQK